MYKYVFATAALAAAVAIGAVLLMMGSYNPFDANAGKVAQIAQGQALYGVRCASCHGKNLEGQPNWRAPLPNGRMPAPPHDKTGHTWHHTDDALTGVTKLGLKPFAGDDYESDMPAFGTILSDEEIETILVYIKSTWPERERNYQQQITQQASPE
jgi:mono/diheme cytochrome c family protein